MYKFRIDSDGLFQEVFKESIEEVRISELLFVCLNQGKSYVVEEDSNLLVFVGGKVEATLHYDDIMQTRETFLLGEKTKGLINRISFNENLCKCTIKAQEDSMFLVITH